MANRFAVILAGGRGERFWPQSRLANPKHLLPIVGDRPLLAQTVDRLRPAIPAERILVVTNREQAAAVHRICPDLPAGNIVAEPIGRDTAAAVGLALVLVRRRDPAATFAMLPADHVIPDAAAFRADVETAFAAAEQSPRLVTIGIEPTEPATGFGYIQHGASLPELPGVMAVRRFVEKPNRARAEEYVRSGEYSWNAGMFFWRASTIAEAFAKFVPDLWQGLLAVERELAAGRDLAEVLAALYPGLAKISVDYAILEKADNVAVVPAHFGWDDVGSWPAVTRHFTADGGGNVVRGLTVLEDAADNLVVSSGDHLVALLGVKDLVVVHTADATLVCPKERAQEIKTLLKHCETPVLKRYL